MVFHELNSQILIHIMILYFFKSEKKFSSLSFFNCIIIHFSMTSLFIDSIAHFVFYIYFFSSSQSLFIFIHFQMPVNEKINKRSSNDKLEKQAPSRKRLNQDQNESSRSQTAEKDNKNDNQHFYISITFKSTFIELQHHLNIQEHQLAFLSTNIDRKFKQQSQQLELILQYLQENQGTHQNDDEDDEQDQEIITSFHRNKAFYFPMQFVKNIYS